MWTRCCVFCETGWRRPQRREAGRLSAGGDRATVAPAGIAARGKSFVVGILTASLTDAVSLVGVKAGVEIQGGAGSDTRQGGDIGLRKAEKGTR
jgi:hypothetical protein